MLSSRNFCPTRKSAATIFLAVIAASFSVAGQTPADIVPHSTPAEIAEGQELNKGAEAYRNARYDEAIAHFEKASELSPDEPIARLYLATALSGTLIPGLDTPENLRIAQKAIDNFKRYLGTRPHDVNPMKQIASVYFSIGKLDDAKTWQKSVLDEDQSDPEAAYTIGVIDWTLAHQNALKALSAVGLNDDGEGNTDAPAQVMAKIRAENSRLVEEALLYLNRAVKIRPDYDDAMAYLNLIYRCKADVDWGNEAARKEDIAEADEWRTKAMAARKARAEQNGTPVPSRQ